MLTTKAPRLWFAALAGVLAMIGYSGQSLADDSQDVKALKDQIRAMMQQIDQLNKQVDALSQKQAQQAAAPPPAAVPAGPPPEPKFDAFMKDYKATQGEPKLAAFLKGFYGTLDVSFDEASKGIKGNVAYPYNYANGTPTTPIVVTGGPKAGPVGPVGSMLSISTNKSQIGYRMDHKIDDSDWGYQVQVETALSVTASPGLRTSWTQQSNVVTGAIGLGDTFVGVQEKQYGKLKFGTTYAPYKKSTDRMNPFSGMLGDYAAIMGNTGGDNRVEFGTRLDHSLWYESPKWGPISFDALWSPGQNRTYDAVIQSQGSPDCNGGNMPGSGNLPLACDDGGFLTAYSFDVKFEMGGLYATAAYELHKSVNRNSDGVGSNNPYYGYLLSSCPNPLTGVGCSALLNWGEYGAIVAEFPQWASVAGGTPEYANDVADESAFKVGAQYVFPFGTTVSGIYEMLRRSVPLALEFQNERERMGWWFSATQDITSRDNFAVGYGYAGSTPGDPGGQHNYDPLGPANTAYMITAAWKHRLDKQLYWYIDWSDTVNHGNAHFDMGAGGRGLTTDCHDGTSTVLVDGASGGPTTWGGCHEYGFSTGLDFKF